MKLFVIEHHYPITSNLFLTSAFAQEPAKIIVRSGEPALIASAESAISKEKGNHGQLHIFTQGTEPKLTYKLIYFPPPGAESLEDTVTYILGTVTYAVPVSVRISPPTLTDSQIYGASFKALFALFIIAVNVEASV